MGKEEKSLCIFPYKITSFEQNGKDKRNYYETKKISSSDVLNVSREIINTFFLEYSYLF